MNDFIPMSRPYIGSEEIDAVAEVLKSGWITTGPKCAEFEQRFAAYVGSPHALALASGTAGLHLLLRALHIGPGDEVITPSMTFASTANQIMIAGARPVFADIDYDTLLVRPDEIARLVTKNTKAVIPVHFAGAPADLDAIEDACRGIPLIEDAAHAVGTFYKGAHIGARNPAIYSFHPIKNITTGEGGMITGGPEDLMKKLKLMKFHGIERDAWKRYGKASDPSYDIAEPGFKYNLTDMQAALGIVQLAKIGEINAKRTRIAKRYLDGLSNLKGLDLPGIPTYAHVHSWHLFVVKARSIGRAALMQELAERNIGYGLHFPACHALSYVREHLGTVSLPETEAAAESILSIPLYPSMEDSQIDRVILALREICG
ncbi:MAG TPA: aminotransferase class I/II-fold pyridoxal phosphate-dependent enzyme [Deltaproteobacteria bacterium]|nr:aminotransferase class I/II-fold pyridoxal phosphate-dependent enzyme [Deltaproteobacteria bacterium]HXK47139.1 aminotransferase class I/II-fold pyridoxal phosphate-dependent enzyme [Deltaproteobacteria bacterium]